ncbi:hypothetical protein N836_15445 [Leptolyngbya sp. Heron Island J]|uniref:DUF3143 domain-containing protein n=1 Tax=Leptolyngbya sp. Heron Island J TaxID=1385935 RepID=UPI0003B9E34F|nr:DUF3143 domain-containing protein [Leptolyngbya sp. Heron Island J]ESA34813.1 hypothetical protein N836_15445 [Leptolyngbya sp. Heron Island J]
MALPSADTPLYNHTLPDIELWLTQQGCKQDSSELNRWQIAKAAWQADLILETDSLVVRYLNVGDASEDIQRGFKYSLSRQDLEDAIFAGP